MSTRVPIVIVMGATGTGKSKLAIQLAKKFNGEIISADSMQVYRGLDIASNKVTRAERAEVPHHLLDICRPTDRFTVMDFRRRTLPIIDDILKRRKLPIIVGGTDYYIECILWESLTTGPPVEVDELVDEHYHVISAPEIVNKWQTFEASVRPTLNEAMSAKAPSHCESAELRIAPTISYTVTRSPDMIRRLVDEFGDRVRDIARELNVNTSVYLKTFYRLPGSSRADQSAERNQQFQPPSENFDFVDVELALLNHYLHACLRKLAEKLADNDDDWRADEMCRELISRCWDRSDVATVINEALISRVDFGKLLERICELGSADNSSAKCHEFVSVLHDSVKAITEIRIERLKLLRISDDVSMLDYMNDALYNELKLVDSKSTELIHPNNRRKIIRALQVYFQEGIPFSKFLQEQHHQEGGDGSFPPMRFPDACLLWLTCDQDILTKRLNERVDDMMKEGLMDELEKFHEDYNVDRLKNNIQADYTKGIFQSIGLKEFHKYLMLSPEGKCSPEGQKALRCGIHCLKLATIRYSKNQYRRVSNRYIYVPSERTVPPIFQLDCSYLEQWNEKVENVAFDIVDAYLRGENLKELKHEPVEIEEPDANRFENGKFICDICDKVFIGKYQWQAHYTSKGHRKQLYRLKVREFQKKLSALGPTIKKEPDDTIEYGEISELFG